MRRGHRCRRRLASDGRGKRRLRRPQPLRARPPNRRPTLTRVVLRAVTCTLDANKALLDRPARTDRGLPRARLHLCTVPLPCRVRSDSVIPDPIEAYLQLADLALHGFATRQVEDASAWTAILLRLRVARCRVGHHCERPSRQGRVPLWAGQTDLEDLIAVGEDKLRVRHLRGCYLAPQHNRDEKVDRHRPRLESINYRKILNEPDPMIALPDPGERLTEIQHLFRRQER